MGNQIQLISNWGLQTPKLISVSTSNSLITFKNKTLENFVIMLGEVFITHNPNLHCFAHTPPETIEVVT